MPLDILDVIETRSEGVIDINNEDFPVRLAFIEESHDAQNLDLLDLTSVPDGLTNLAHVERVIVAVGASLGVLLGGVFPGLGKGTVVPDVTWVDQSGAVRGDKKERKEKGEKECAGLEGWTKKKTLTVVGETVADETELALLDVCDVSICSLQLMCWHNHGIARNLVGTKSWPSSTRSIN